MACGQRPASQDVIAGHDHLHPSGAKPDLPSDIGGPQDRTTAGSRWGSGWVGGWDVNSLAEDSVWGDRAGLAST